MMNQKKGEHIKMNTQKKLGKNTELDKTITNNQKIQKAFARHKKAVSNIVNIPSDSAVTVSVYHNPPQTPKKT